MSGTLANIGTAAAAISNVAAVVGELVNVGGELAARFNNSKPARDASGHTVVNDHSILTQVGDISVWLRRDLTRWGENTVSMPLWHAWDSDLPLSDAARQALGHPPLQTDNSGDSSSQDATAKPSVVSSGTAATQRDILSSATTATTDKS